MPDQFVRKYYPPSLNGHKILYKGKRYWVFEVSEEFPFDGYGDSTDFDFDFVIFDKSNEIFMKKDYINGGVNFNEGIVAFCRRDPDEGFTGATWYGQHDITFRGETVKDLVNSYIATEKWLRAMG